VPAVDYDPYSDSVMRDPWPHYAALRREAPVLYLEQYDTWFLSTFEDIWQGTTQDMFSAERGVAPQMVLLKQAPPPDPVFSMLDMPRQRDYRRMFVPRYTRRAVQQMEGAMRRVVRELLAPLAREGRLDVYADLAMPLAIRVSAGMLGMSVERMTQLAELVATFMERRPGQVGPEARNEAAMGEMMALLAEFVAESRRTPPADPDSHIAVLLNGLAEGQRLSDGAILGALHTMVITGIEVLPLSVANTVMYLWRHPDQRSAVVEDPALVPYAFAESLRYDQPTNLLGRFVKEPVELRGQKLQPGQGVIFLWASGNRDEAEFDRPDVFDIHRRPQRSLSFGHGYHKCIGEHLANLEGRLLLEELLAVAPDYEDVAGAERIYGEFLHGYQRVPIEFRAAS
jgi:cytochrome P450